MTPADTALLTIATALHRLRLALPVDDPRQRHVRAALDALPELMGAAR